MTISPYAAVAVERLDRVSTILVLCWGLIGDVFVRVPLLEALRKRFPQAHIAVVVDPVAVAVLEHHPDCDEVISFDRNKKQRWRYLRETVARLVELRRRRFSLCLNFYIGGSSNRFLHHQRRHQGMFRSLRRAALGQSCMGALSLVCR